MYERSVTRDLMDFFAADLPREPRAAKRRIKALPSGQAAAPAAKRKRAKVLDV